MSPSCTAVPRPRRDVIETTSPGRYMVQFTASAALREKLERLRALMVDAAGANDLAAVIEQAVTEKLERLEARRFGRTKRPCLARRPPEPPVARPAPREVDDARDGAGTSSARGSSAGGGGESQSPVLPVPIPSRHIPAAIRRAVYERAGGRCTYTDERGRRCEARTRLHFHHRLPWAYGGRHEASLITLLCSSHHALATEAEFGVRWSRRLLHGQGGGKAPNVDAR